VGRANEQFMYSLMSTVKHQHTVQGSLRPIKPEINTFKIDFPFPFKNGSILTFSLHLEIKTRAELSTICFDRLKSSKEFRAGMSETHQNPKVCLVSKFFVLA
jgi:hypothetical protein